LATRLIVARRQFNQWSDQTKQTAELIPFWETEEDELWLRLWCMFGSNTKLHLDHDPPLAARKKIKRGGIVVGYEPDANDPDYLTYRTADDHRLKTNVRGDGAQYPDRVLIKKIRRIERPRPKRKYKWPSRPFQSKRKKHAIKTRLPP
jgi:hypothetical protein